MTPGFAIKSEGVLNKGLLLGFLFIFYGWVALAQTTTFSGIGNWSDDARWDNGVPDITYDVIIASGADCTLDMDAFARSLSFAPGSINSTVTISGTNTLTIESELAYSVPSGSADQVLAVNDGALIVGSVFMPNSGSNNRNLMLTVNDGSVTVSGDVEMQGSSSRNYITFTGAGTLNVTGNLNNSTHGRITANAATINVGGDMRVAVFTANSSTLNIAGEFSGVYFWGAGSTVNYTGGDQTILNTTYYNLTISGGGTNPLRGATTITTGGTLTLTDGKLNLAGYDLTMNNTSSFAGAFSNTAMLDFANSGRLRYYSTTAAGWQRVYPIGSGNEYSPMEITNASATNTNMYIEVIGERHPLLAGSDNAITRYWKLNPANTGLRLTGTFTYHDNDVQAPIVETDLIRVGRLAYTGWETADPSSGYNHGTNTISFDGVTDAINAIGIYTLGESNGCFETVPYRYTVNSGSWNTAAIWNGGTVPAAGEDIYILHAISLDIAASPGNVVVEVTGSLNMNTQNFTVTGTTEVIGFITDGNNGGTNTFRGLVTIHEGGSISTGHTSPFIFEGGITNNGTFSKTGAGAVTLKGGQTINNAGGNTMIIAGAITKNAIGKLTITNADDSPIIFNTSFTTHSDVDITGAANITSTGAFTINGSSTVTNTNTAEVIITGALNGNNAASTWLNNNGSTLRYRNAAQPFNTNGVLNASAEGNTVIYELNGAQAIRTTATTYHHLIMEGNNTKTVGGVLNINGDFILQNNTNSNFTVSSGANNVSVGGDFVISNSGFATTFNQTSGTLSANNLIINGGNIFNLNSSTTSATFSGNIEISNSSTLRIGTVAGNYVIKAEDINISAGSTIEVPNTANGLHTIILNGNVINYGTLNLYATVARNASLVFNSDVAHAFSGSPEAATRMFNFTLNADANTTTAGYPLTIFGSVNIGANSTFNAGLHTHSVATNWANAGTLSSMGTITFNGVAQNIGAEPNFYDVLWEGTGTKTISGHLDVAGDFIVNAGITINSTEYNITVTDNIIASNTAAATFTQTTGTVSANNLIVNGTNTFNFNTKSTIVNHIQIDNGNTLRIGSVAGTYSMDVGGNLTNEGTFTNSTNSPITINGNLTQSGTFTSGTGVYTFTGADKIIGGNSPLIITNSRVTGIYANNNTALVTFTNLTVDGQLTNNQTITIPTSLAGTGNLIQGNGGTLNIGTTAANLTITTLTASADANTVNYYAAAQDIKATTYHHLNLSGSNIKTFAGEITVNNNLSIEGTTTSFYSNHDINIGGDLFIQNIAGQTCNFGGTSSTLNINGNIEIANASVFNLGVTAGENKTINVGGNITIPAGATMRTLNGAATEHVLSVNGVIDNSGSIIFWQNVGRTCDLVMNLSSDWTLAGTEVTLNHLTLNNTGGAKTITQDVAEITLRGDFSIGTNNHFTLSGNALNTYGGISIATEGGLTIDDNASLTFYAAGNSIENAGALTIQGSDGNEATINASAVGNRYFINNTTGSSLVMQHYFVDYLTGNGISVSAGASADIPADNFSFGTFGANSNSTQCLLLTGVDFDTHNPVTATDVAFNNTVGYNVSRTSGTGSIDFYDATGPRAGQSFENDSGNPGDLVNWFYPSSTYFTIASGDFLDPAIWNSNPTGNFDNASSSFQIRDGHDVILNGDIDVLELIVGEGTSGSLTIGNSADIRTLATREHLTVMAGAVVTVGSAAAHQVMIYGNLINDGSMQLRSSSSNIADVSFLGINSKINGANTVNFNSVIFASGTIAKAYQPMNIQQNVIIENNAIFDDAGFTHTVGRNWTETGSGRRIGQGTIAFNGVVNTISSTDGSNVEFFNVVCSGAGATDFTTIDNVFTTYIYGDLNVNDTKEVRLINDHMVVSGDFQIAGSAKFSSSASVVTFDGTNPQQINLAGDVNFYDMAFSGTSAKTVSGNIITSRFLTIHSDAIVEGAGSHDIGNTLTIDGTCNFSGSITMRAGSITSNNPEIHLANLSSLFIAGNISLTTTSTLNVITGGNVEITSNYLIVNENTSLTNTGTGSFILGDGLNLYIRATDGFPLGFASYQLSESSNVRYDRDLPQIIRGGADVAYGNLRIGNTQNANPQQRQADGNIIIRGDMDITATTRQILFDLGGFDLTISGNILNTNVSTIEMSAGGTLTLNAEDANQTFSIGTYNLNNVVLTLDAPTATRTKTFTNGSTINISGNVSASCGSAGSFVNNIIFNNNSVSGTANSLILGQNTQITTTAVNAATNIFNAFDGDINLVNGTIHFANTTATQFIPHSVIYGNIAFSGTQIKQATGNLTIAGNVSVAANTPYFKAAGFTHSVGGNWLLGAANTRLADMSADDKIVFNGIDQFTLPCNFMHLEIANTGTASVSGGNIIVFGDFAVKNDATFEAGVRSISIHGNWISEPAGVFTQESDGSVNFVGQTTNQSITSNENSYFWNLIIDKNNGPENQTVIANSNINVRNNLNLVANAAVFNLNNHQLNVGRNLTIRDNTHIDHNAFIAGTGTVVMDGYLDVQHLHHYSSRDLVLHNLIFNSPTNKYVRTLNASSPSRNVIITGNWINNFENVYGYSIHHGSSFVNFFVQGNWVNNGTFYHVNDGTVTFNGADQQIGSSDFWNVVFANEGVKTLSHGHMTVKRDLLIEDNVTLDVSENDYNILVARHWDMSAEGAVFNARNGLVRFDGNGTIFTGLEGENPNKSFWNIDISANVSINGDLDVDNDFRIISGTFTTGSNKVFFGGDFSNNGTFNHTSTPDAQVIFNATSGPRSIDPGTGVAFRTVTIDAPGVTYNVLNEFSINNNYDLTINQGTLHLNGNKLRVNSANTRIVINSGGEFVVNENATMEFSSSNQSIQNQGGVLRVVGTPDFDATFTRISGSYYITQTSGVFHAQHYRFEMIGAGTNGGVKITGGTIDAENNFSNGAFISGSSSANTTAYLDLNELEIDNNTNLVMSNVIFNGGGTTNRNIWRNAPPSGPNDGIVFCQDCIGTLAGPSFEMDDGSAESGYVQWTYPSGFFWVGVSSDSWHENANWEGGTAPYLPTHNVYFDPGIFSGTNIRAVISEDVSCGNIIILNNTDGLGFEVGEGNTLTINGLLNIEPGGFAGLLSASSIINIYSHWQNAGTFHHGDGTVRFLTSSGTINILPGVSNSFYNLEFNSSANAVFALGSDILIINDLSIHRGTFDVLNRDITIGGNWFMEPIAEANFDPRNRTVFFSGAGQTITNGTFHHLNLSGSGITTLESNITISGDINIGTNATLDGQNFDLYIGRNWTNNNLFLQSGSGTVVFNGGTQQVDNGSQVTSFNRVIFAGTGTKTFHQASEVWGDLTINNASSVNFSTFIIDGGITENSLVNNGYMFINGPNNFPENFETISMAPNSRVYYNYNGGDQIIRTNDATWSYGNLYLGNNSGTIYRKFPEAGDLIITGSLVISNNDVVLDMDENSANMILTGNITLPAGGQQIDWGTGTTKLTHVGGDWNINANIEGFNNLELGGASGSWKRMYNDLIITGDVTIKNSVRLMMDPNNLNNPKTMICTQPGKTFTMESNSRLYSAITSNIGVAAPTGFENYNLANNSRFYLRSPNGTEQTIFTGNGIEYGNLYFQNTKHVVSDGVAALRVNGLLNTGTSSFNDNGQDIFVRQDVHLHNYTASPGTTFTFFGPAQNITNGSGTEPNPLNFYKVVFSGSGIKTLGNRSVVNIAGNLQISSNVRLTSGRDIYFYGENWNCEGRFEHAGGRTVYVSGTNDQIINPGPLHELNLFRNIEFTGENDVIFTDNGATINGNFTISGAATVNLGNLSHHILGNIENISGGTLQSALADITFNGGNQNIRTPGFEANNVNIWGTGTKRMFSNWIVNGDVNIVSTLNNHNNIDNIHQNIEARSNWSNSGNFTHNNFGWVNFNAPTEVGIDNGTSNFNNVSFGNDEGGYILYNLIAPITNIRRSMHINQDAHLLLNGNTLILGASLADGKNALVRGLLDVDAGATLAFDNRSSVYTLLVDNAANPTRATLRILGASDNAATLTRFNTRGAEVIIENGIIEAQYYLIEYLSNNGIDIRPSATLHPSNNFSNGTFSNINNVAGARYLRLEAGTYEGGEIENIAFNVAGVPVAGLYNLERQISDPPITLGGIITGDLGGYMFEKDELTEVPAVPQDATRGRLRWPEVNETQWIGVVNADWSNPANWSDGVPTSAMDAVIPGGVPNNPVLNVNAFCKSLRITSGTLEIDGGFNLTTYSDITIGEGTALGRLIVSSPESAIVCGGSWTRGINGQFIHGNGTVIFNTASASATINPLNSNFHNVAFNNSGAMFTLSGSVINILGNLELLNGTLVPNTSGYVINLGGDFNNQGNFTQGNGTVVLNGAGDQTITNGVFNHLTVGGSGTKYSSNGCTIHGNTLVVSTLHANEGSTIDFRGNVLIQATGTFHDGDQTHTFNGATWTGTGAYLGEGTMVFNRTDANQTINASSFHNLEIDCTGRILFLGGDATVAGNMTIKAGVNRVDIMDHLITNTTGLGEFYAENGVSIRITGADHFPKNFTSYFMENTTNVNYMGDGDQIIRGGLNVVYGNLTLTNNSVKTLDGDIEIQRDLAFNNATLDVSPNNYTISISRNWNNTNASGGIFVPRQGEVIFNRADGNPSISVHDNSVNPFFNLTVDLGANSILIAPGNKEQIIQNNLLVNEGRYSANGRTTAIGGDMYALNGTFVNSGTFLLNKVSGEARIRTNYNYNNNTGAIRNITIDAGATYTLESDFAAYGDINIVSGTFNGNGHTVALGSSSAHSIQINGTYIFGSGGRLLVGNGGTIAIGATGVFEMVGTPDQNAVLTNNMYYGGRYGFVMNGLIKAEHYQFMFMNQNGIRISASGVIDSTHNLSNGTFTSGQNNGTFLVIENNQTFVEPNYIANVNFPASPGGAGAKNVEKTLNEGRVEFYEATGNFSGEPFENDPFNRVDWTGQVVLTWNGSVSSDWNNAHNWTASIGPGIVPTGNEDVIITNVTNSPRLTISGQKAKKLTINTGARLIIETDYDDANTDLEVFGDFEILGNGTLEIAGINDFVTVAGSWFVPNTATLLNNGHIRFNGIGAVKTINNGNKSFYNLTIDGSTSYVLANNVTVRNNLTILAGASLDLSASNFSMSVAGNWSNNGDFIPRNGTVILNALSANRSINNGNSSFHHLTINAPGSTYSLSVNDIRINGNMNLVSGTFSHNQLAVYMGDGIGSDELNVSVAGVYLVGPNGVLRFGANAQANISNGGVFRAVGTGTASRATITRSTTGSYGFTVENTGVFGAQYYLFEYMNASGFHLRPGAMLEAVNNLSNGVFSNGFPGGTYLWLENEMPAHPEDEDILNITFNNGPVYNITRLTGGTVVNISDAFGPLGNFTFENDAVMPPSPITGLITWSLLNTSVWTGNTDTNWHNADNWIGDVPDETKNVEITTGTFHPEIFAGPAFAQNISLESGAILTVNEQNLTIAEELWFAGTINAIGSPHITVGGSWVSASGTFNAGQSRVVLNAPAGIYTVNQSTGNFYSLEIAGSGTYNQQVIIRLNNDLILTSGTLASNGRNIYVGGSWINTGGNYIAGTRTVFMDGEGDNILNPGSSTFYHLRFTGTATTTLEANTIVTRDYIQSSGIVNLNGYNLTINHRFTLNGGEFSGGSGNITVRENLVISGSGVFNSNTSTVIMTASNGTRSINPRNQQFYNLTINGNALFNLGGALVINNNLSILRGTLSVTTNNHPVTINGNWLNNSVFSAQSGTVSFVSVNPQQISGTSSNQGFFNVVVGNTSDSGLTLLRPVTISGHLLLNNGTINNTASSILTFTNGATSSEGGDNSFVNGPVRKIGSQAFLFPLGKNNIYAPLRITPPALSTDAFTAEYFFQTNAHVNHACNNCSGDINNVSTTEYWDLTRNSGTSTPNVTLYFKNMERSGLTDIDDLVFAHFNGSLWVSKGMGGISDGDNMCHIVGTGFTSYSPLTAGSHAGLNPLPIDLLYFNASFNEPNISVQWATATEINNDYFTIEASIDGVNYEVIGYIDGAGNSNSTIEYSYYFTPESSGLVYVRLKQTDFDGEFEYFKPVVVNCEVFYVFEPEIVVFPNPTKGLINIHGLDGNSSIVVYDQLMKVVKTLQSEESSVTLDLLGHQPGIYFIQIQSINKQYVRRVIYQR
ncbi:MAG: T9SS C-terminal target domain-containing protein [Bacteroidetes bacterium]|nr:MAG: T9SS C-terminal target domain-containing protein [Bacteroidota bacterium]